ncbi:hypothetical protein FQN54_005575 [Arachnomyces sp. PD_36]|nr:hypothetical protein FQN54_005575 [Arachnomyces sp. PD_36]
MSTTIVLITGANTGIGFQIVRALASASKPYHIIVGARSTAKADGAIKAVQDEFPSSLSKLSSVVIDLEDDESIQNAFNEVSADHGRLDVLINNAGGQFEPQHMRGEISEREAWNKSWNLNTAGTQIVTSTFVPLLLKSAEPRLLFVTSGASALSGTEDPAVPVNTKPPPGWPKTGFLGVPAYRSAKTGLNMLMREWHRVLEGDRVKVFAISPGLLATGLGGNPEFLKKIGAKDPAIAGPFIRSVVEGERDADVGKILSRDGIQAW